MSWYAASIHAAERPCDGDSYTDPKVRKQHEGHQTGLDCYLATWDPPPLPWVRGGPPRFRCWHLAIGIRKDTGAVQLHCNRQPGPGPNEWREKPTLDWHTEPGAWFCRSCVAEWTKGVYSVTVRVDSITVKKGQLTQLLEKLGGTELLEVRLRQTNVEDRPALVAEWDESSGRDKTTKRVLLVGNGVVDL